MPTTFTPSNPRLKPAPGFNFSLMRGGLQQKPEGLYPSPAETPGLYPSANTAAAGAPAALPKPNIPANFASGYGGVALPAAPRTDAPLPTGAPVDAPVPGLFESVHTPPMLNDPAGAPGAAAPTPSKYTLMQTTDPASGMPQSALNTSADAIALASLLTPGTNQPAPQGHSSTGAASALAAADSFADLGAAGSALQGAAGLERTRLSLAAQDIMKREAGNVPLPTDSPEIRANKLNYLTKRVGSAAAATGLPSNTHDLAATATEISRMAGQPRLATLGKDASGRSVEGTVDRNGNFSRITPKDETTGGTQLAKLVAERDTFAKAGRTEIVAQYDSAIKNYGAKYDAFGNPIGGPSSAAATTTPAPTAATTSDQDKQALAWATANPTDPRSVKIKARLGIR